MTDMLQEVLRSGTAAGVRSRGFKLPAAGKTGTSHDGWFAGFTSELLCVVWVGFDDNRDLGLSGSQSAAPIWAEFMKRALGFREYRNAKEIVAPEGIVSVEIDPLSGMPATPYCPKTRMEVYIAGTQPVGTCPLHGGGRPGVTNVAGWETPAPAAKPQPDGAGGLRITGSSGDGQVPPAVVAQHVPGSPSQPDAAAQPAEQPPNPKPKKGLFRRLWGVLK